MAPRNKPVYGSCNDIPTIDENPNIDVNDDQPSNSNCKGEHDDIDDLHDEHHVNYNNDDNHEDEDDRPNTEQSLDFCIELAASDIDEYPIDNMDDIDMYIDIDISPFEALDSVLDNQS